MAGLVPGIHALRCMAMEGVDGRDKPGHDAERSCTQTHCPTARPARRQGHARRRPRAGADRSARGADLLAQSSAVGALDAAEPAGAALRPSRAAAATPASCCATTATAWSSAPPRFSPPPATPTSRYLQGGIAAWEKAGLELFSGVNVPSKAFGEHIEHACHTPSVSAEELDGLMRSGTDMVVVDSRPFDEFQRVSIPSATNVPGRRAGAAHPRHRAVARHAGRGQLRRPHPQHHRRAIADQRRPAEQGRGAAQRHDGLDARRPDARQRQDQALRRAVRPAASPGPSPPPSASARSSASCGSTPRRWRASAPTRRARSMCSTCAIRPNTPPAICRARSTRRAASWCRRPTSMPARSARASC